MGDKIFFHLCYICKLQLYTQKWWFNNMWSFEGNNDTHVALAENEFDTSVLEDLQVLNVLRSLVKWKCIK